MQSIGPGPCGLGIERDGREGPGAHDYDTFDLSGASRPAGSSPRDTGQLWCELRLPAIGENLHLLVS
jgi:hypothetical protein